LIVVTILNDPTYGSESSRNGLRFSKARVGKHLKVTVFLSTLSETLLLCLQKASQGAGRHSGGWRGVPCRRRHHAPGASRTIRREAV
jgi:sulfur relay (sulfurtransferase) complex TusBCD TusD component (DsrE family)